MKPENASNRQPVRGIVFDKDGTLLDFNPTWLPAYQAGAMFAADGDRDLARLMMVSGGLDEKTNNFRHGSLLASSTTDKVAEAWVSHGSKYSVAQLIPRLDEIFAEQTYQSSKPFAGLFDLISDLSQRNIVLGVATHDSERSAHAFLKKAGIEGFFPFVAGYDSGHGCKPGPGMVQAFCAALDLPPGAVMVVGDNHCDLEMGRNAGAGYVVGVLSGNGARAELEPHADVVISGISDLPSLEFA